MTKAKRKKSLVGWVRRSEWKFIQFKDKVLHTEWIGNEKEFDDDIKVRITIEEL